MRLCAFALILAVTAPAQTYDAQRQNYSQGKGSLPNAANGTNNFTLGPGAEAQAINPNNHFAVGLNAGYFDLGFGNLWLGNFAGPLPGSTLTNAMAIGNNAIATANNTVQIGNPAQSIYGGFADTIYTPDYSKTVALFIGDSLTAGFIIGLSNSWATWLTAPTGSGGQGLAFGASTNVAITGQFTGGVVSNLTTQIGAFAPGQGSNGIMFLQIGINNADLGSNVVQTLADYTTIINYAHSVGFQVFLFDLPDNYAAGFHEDMEQRRNLINDALATSSALWDYYLPVSLLLPDPNAAPWAYADGLIHWSVWTAQNLIAPKVAATLRRPPHTQYHLPPPRYTSAMTSFCLWTNNSAFLGGSGSLGNTNATGPNILAAGFSAAANLGPNASNMVILGDAAATTLVSGSNLTVLGLSALQSATNATFTLAAGDRVAISATNVTTSVILGSQAAQGAASVSSSVLIGLQAALAANSTLAGDVFIGPNCVAAATTTFNSTGVGPSIFPNLTSGPYNTGGGYKCGQGLVNGASNTLYGAQLALSASQHNIIAFSDGGGNIALWVGGVGQPLTVTNGYASWATNLATVTTTGLTNLTTGDLDLTGLTGISLVYTNLNSGTHTSLGTITVGIPFHLKPNCVISGTSVAATLCESH